MQVQLNNYNPLQDILELFPLRNPTYMTALGMDMFCVLLAQAGVHCGTQKEVMQCLYILRDMDVLELHEETINNTKYIKVGNKLNGKVTQQDS